MFDFGLGDVIAACSIDNNVGKFLPFHFLDSNDKPLSTSDVACLPGSFDYHGMGLASQCDFLKTTVLPAFDELQASDKPELVIKGDWKLYYHSTTNAKSRAPRLSVPIHSWNDHKDSNSKGLRTYAKVDNFTAKRTQVTKKQ